MASSVERHYAGRMAGKERTSLNYGISGAILFAIGFAIANTQSGPGEERTVVMTVVAAAFALMGLALIVRGILKGRRDGF